MITDEEFRLFRNLIREESGIYLRDSRKDFLEHRLALRMRATGMSGLYWYYRLVSDQRKTELPILLDILTINETSFFRNRPQMDFFRDLILPDVLRKKDTKRLRIWSAGCSTGEEPYSIAMMVRNVVDNLPLSAGGSMAGWDIKIFASDLSLTALETARRGRYEKHRVDAAVDAAYISRYFREEETAYAVRDELRDLVLFDLRNLKNDDGICDLDIIFCRNVMIYFAREEQKRLIDKFCGNLVPGGYLFVGHAESLQGMHQGFDFVHDGSGSAYKKITS